MEYPVQFSTGEPPTARKCLFLMKTSVGEFLCVGEWNGRNVSFELFQPGYFRPAETPVLIGWTLLANGLSTS